MPINLLRYWPTRWRILILYALSEELYNVGELV